ncbi:von Willebrand factor [Eucyclogobius newberryi]|uniref:von Willebrand factor n=1 Tax=Eucyclogobius newberryi TaxID=166745 RepID=UPI003B5B4B9B
MEVHWRFLLHLCTILHLTARVTGAKGRCSLFGRQHIHTFDGVLYAFSGDCSYLLAGDCTRHSFTLLGDFMDSKRIGVTLFLGDAFELHLSVDGILSQGEKILPVPYASHSLFVGTELGFYKLWSEEFGFSVTIDNAANVALTLSEQHANGTCGLCGNYNGLTADEYTAQEGFVTEDSYDFANSWAVKAAGQSCQRVTPPSMSCNSTKRTTEILSSCSALGQLSVFRHCAHVVPPEGFMALCEQDACHCEGSQEECYCPVLLEYARTCHAHGIVLSGWTAQSQCLPKCPMGMQYSECTRSCSTTCHNLNIHEVCTEDCSDGCTCPVGKVLDGKRCVEVSLCSCVHMGRHFPPGSTISQDCNTCVCRHGSWECTNEGCPGECLVFGQSHFKTFDDKFFTFIGQCQYLLAKDCAENDFSVIIENVQCADDQDAVCTRSVTLSLPSLENMTIKFKHGGMVSINSMDIQTPMHHGPLHIQRSVQSTVHVRFREDFQIEWDGRGHLRLKLGPQWQGRTCGLCGNYNGNHGDDFLSGSGLVEGGAQAFAQSWRINGDCEAIHRQEGDPCAANPKRVRFAEEACSVMLSEVFYPCHFLVNPAPYQRFCRYDVCACSDGEECLCSALAAYASACSIRGVLLSWRSPSLCAMQCSGGQVYKVCGRTCERTCRALSGSEPRCGAGPACEEGCFCPTGKYLTDSGQCVTADLCPCLHDGQLYQPKDVYADHHTICYCENGAMHCSSPEEGAMLSDMFYDDDLAPSRERRSVQCAPPLVRPDCEAGGSGLECARTCQNLDLPCVSTLCIPGCLCPPGTVHHRRDCIAPEECPCYHNNRPHASGQTITVDCNTCVCQRRKWQCTDNVCDGVCRSVGAGHYITFDGLKFSFPGLCQYVLVQDMCSGDEGSFRVLVENEACGIVGHRCAKAITIFFQGGVIVMQHGEVKMTRPVLLDSQIQIVRSGHFYTVLLGKHISLSWDKGTHLRVHISAVYRGKVCGLCGNYDGNINNDLMSSNKQLEVDAMHYGNSWKVVPSCADVTQTPPPCNDDIIKLVTVEQSCRVLTGPIFKECNAQVDAEPFVEMCVEAACSCPSVGDCACFCDVVAAYALACSERGLSIRWRSNQLCPVSCEDLNHKSADTGEELCLWKYNACGPACPISCQHPEPLHCSLTCVEGCHAHCPPGQLLDEVLLRCVEPSQCQVCVHDGQTISHGNKILLNPDVPEKCKMCHCDTNTLHCVDCTSSSLTTPAPTLPWVTHSTLPYTTLMPEQNCDRAMDLAFLLDGSEALSEGDFQVTKDFILGVVERFRMGSAHTRATVLLYHSGVKTYDLQVQKWLFKKTVREMHYTGGDAAFLDEAIKYLAINIYDKNKREHAGRVAILLTASENPRPMRPTLKLLRRKSITTLTVALGPEVDMAQINEITKVNPDNRAYILSSTNELNDRLLEVTDYLCTLGLEPEVHKPKTTPTTSTITTTTTTTSTTTTPNLAKSSTKPTFTSPTTTLSPLSPTKDLTFVIEGSDAVGEVNFNKSLIFLEEVISQLAKERGEIIRITIIQYSVTVTFEIRNWEIRRHRQRLVERLREIQWRGGNKTNTGTAITTIFHQMATAPPTGPMSPPQLVFLVTENPPTDTITRPSNMQTQIYPIGVGPNVNEMDLFPLSSPQRPLMVENYFNLKNIVHRVINITRTTVMPRSPTLPPLIVLTLATLPPSVPCDKPMDVLFLLKAGEQFTDAKTFVKSFISHAKIGPKDTHISLVQYGERNTAEITWKQEQSKSQLLNLVDRVPSRTTAALQLGAALRFAIQTALSPASGGRSGVAKIIVMLVQDKSTDDIKEAANEALAAGVSVFPIGVGSGYDRAELNVLGHHGNQDNSLHLSSMDQLLLLLTLDQDYTERMCRAGPPGLCVDDNGIERKPGESWLLQDGCHTLLCHPSGAVTVQSHKVSCDRMEPPACRNNMPAVRVQETCNCHWECPCMCMGSSTNHVVRFDGLALRLDGEGVCSYTLLTMNKSLTESSEVKLHNGACRHPSEYNQVCMKAIEVIHGPYTIILKDDMTAVMGRENLALPWTHAGLELVRYGGIMLQLRSDHGYTLTFTPQSNEFTISVHGSNTAGPTAGLCGACGEDEVNLLQLRNGSLTTDHSAFMFDWSSSGGVGGGEGVCVPKRKPLCALEASMGCQALRSQVFAPCHPVIPVQLFLSRCEEQACEQSDVCELLSTYAHLCRQNGACVHWRGPHLCPFQCPGAMEYHACKSGCVEDCSNIQTLAQETNSSSCVDTPTEGCYCPEGMLLHQGACVLPESCNQCVDQQGDTHAYMQSWVPDENPCLICMCLDHQRINCTAQPCNNAKAPVCGPCEVLREKRESMCCPEFECVCDLINCSMPEVPHCEDGQTLVLKNPGECQPVHECVCKKEQCDLQPLPTCPSHRQPSIKKTKCCDAFECVCNCQNSTSSCPLGFITSTSTNDCGCAITSCKPDKVCVAGTQVYPVGSEWEDGCNKCVCIQELDPQSSLYVAQCAPAVCDTSCPLGSTFAPSDSACCGKCVPSSCVLSHGEMRGDTLIRAQIRHVGEVWSSPVDECVLLECVKVQEQVFVTEKNRSCSVVDIASCPLGEKLHCAIERCCPSCHCVPVDACLFNNTLIGPGERLMVDLCTHCECQMDEGAVKMFKLSCKRTSCSECPMGYSLQREEGSCCGHCEATTCFIQRPDGTLSSLPVNSTSEEGCNLYSCSLSPKGDLVAQVKVTTCPAFDPQACQDHGGKVGPLGQSCCETCIEPECRRTKGTLNYIKVEDCQSEQQVELHYCEGKCRSRSLYSLERGAVERECVCCSAIETQALSVPIVCTNGTRSLHTLLSVTQCDCVSKDCH